MYRVTAVWSGFPGGPGYTNFYFGEATADNAPGQGVALRVRDFFGAFSLNRIPTGVTINVLPTVGIVDPANGVLTDEIALNQVPAPVVGNGAGERSPASGAVVNWRTSTVVAGRRLRGKTFIVPLANNCYTGNGQLGENTLNDLRGAAAALGTPQATDAGSLLVWARPRPARTVDGVVEPARPGVTAKVTSSHVPELVAVLRSRRD